LTDLPGNIGDHLIWAGTVDFLESHQIKFKEISISELSRTEFINGCLLVPGSGALTTHFHEWLPETIKAASERFSKVIILPSQIEPEVVKIKTILKLANVVFFTREVKSFARTKDFARIGLGIDLALFSKKFDRITLGNPRIECERLLSLRTDAASEIISAGYFLDEKLNKDISIMMTNLEDWIHAIWEAQSIVTDRLHVAVAAVMLNKKLFYIDPHDEKISNYFHFTFGSSAPNQEVLKVDFNWLKDQQLLKSRIVT
jgi:exopolysaccharide biosynthesis predicted pyruvyltransferase EpsI